MTDETALVSVMHANNEVGTIQPIAELAAIARAHGALVPHRRRAVGRQDSGRRCATLGVDLLVAVGAQVRRTEGRRRALDSARRAADVAVRPAAGRSATAARARRTCRRSPGWAWPRASRARRSTQAARMAALRDRLERGILAARARHGRQRRPGRRVPNTTNISFDGIEAESLLIALDLEGVAVSTGSACSSGIARAVARAARRWACPHARTRNSLRFSLGPSTTDAEIDFVVGVLPALVAKLRGLGAHRRGRCGSHARRRRDVGRRRFVGRREPARRGRPRRHRPVDAALRSARRRRGVRVAAAASTTCTTRAGWPRRSASRTTSSTSRSEFRETVVRQLRRRVRGGPHADSLRALQRRPEVRDARRARRRASTPPRWPPATTRGWRSTRTGARYRLLRGVDRGQGSVVLPVLADAGSARARDVPGRPPDEARGARARRAARARRRRQARQSRDLLRAGRRRRRLRRAAAAGRRRATGEIVDSAGRVLGRHRGVHRFTVGQRKGLGLVDGRAAVRPQARAGRRRASSSVRAKSSAARPDARRA